MTNYIRHSMTPLDIHPDTWLSAIFRYPAYRVSPTLGNGRSTEPVNLAGLAQSPDAFFFAKIPTQDVSSVEGLGQFGFRVVDVNVTFDRPSSPSSNIDQIDSIKVVDATPVHHPAILDIAASAFVYSRFHLDPHVPNPVANTIKRAWIENYCLGKRGDSLLVALVDGRPAGFAAALASHVHGKNMRVIDLIGVANEFQGRGIGKGLVASFIDRYAGHCDGLRVGTQAANIPSMRLYEQSGFRISETVYVMHAHVKNGKLL
jgi:GNAT superfamily N-acetyltransferase